MTSNVLSSIPSDETDEEQKILDQEIDEMLHEALELDPTHDDEIIVSEK